MNIKTNDRSLKSTDWLISRILKSQFCTEQESVYFLDRDLFFGKGQSVENVVCFGNVYRNFSKLNSDLNDAKLWVLCEANRNLLIGLGTDSDRINLIPRDKIIKSRSMRFCLETMEKEKGTLIYSGRCSPEKHISATVYLLSKLQYKISNTPDVHFYFCSSPEFPEYEAEMLRLIEVIDWKTPPKIFWNLSQEEWLNGKTSNPCLVSLSTFLCEDFGVSVAQAEEAGWMLLLSPWGGHLEIKTACFMSRQFMPFLGERVGVQNKKIDLMLEVIGFENNVSSTSIEHKHLGGDDLNNNFSNFWLTYNEFFLNHRIEKIVFIDENSCFVNQETTLYLDISFFKKLRSSLLERNIDFEIY